LKRHHLSIRQLAKAQRRARKSELNRYAIAQAIRRAALRALQNSMHDPKGNLREEARPEIAVQVSFRMAERLPACEEPSRPATLRPAS